ncbi:endonuclease/exonuclease/phosphatase family protein [Simkania negevensis]|uniref:Endonuclease/exonuclease/phosphatase family protein n=1 Tax=Simkania negevensis TaxID=83561 RepID=A0ABS3AT34_9BACT|nr:endonuclease/exonuclease/phosphatase family protein [Simkania negevensis]
MSFTIGTYNILAEGSRSMRDSKESLFSNFDREGRMGKIVQNIKQTDLDVVCLQEVTRDVFTTLQATLTRSGYTGYFVQHKKGQPDGVAIFYKRTVFSYPKHQELDLSTQETSKHSLILNLTHTATHKTICVATTHLSGGDKKPLGREEAIQLQEHLAGATPVDLTVVAGDFNQDQEEETYERSQEELPEDKRGVFFQAGYQNDNNTEATEIRTCDDKERHIDWIVSKGADRLQHVGLKQERDASDHLMTATRAFFQEAASRAPSNASSSAPTAAAAASPIPGPSGPSTAASPLGSKIPEETTETAAAAAANTSSTAPTLPSKDPVSPTTAPLPPKGTSRPQQGAFARFFSAIGDFFAAIGHWFANLFKRK